VTHRTFYALSVLVLLLAAGLRLWELNSLPPGLSDIEIHHIRLAETIRNEGTVVVFADVDGQGHDAFYHIGLALLTNVLGNGVLGYRLIFAFAGLIAVAMLNALASRLYGRTAGLASMALMAVHMHAILFSRIVTPEALLPLLVTTVLLALTWVLPVYAVRKTVQSSIQAAVVLGGSIGLGLYLHPDGLVLALVAMFVTLIYLVTHRPVPFRQLSYIGFTSLVILIITIPFFLSTLRQAEMSSAARLLAGLEGNLSQIGTWLAGLAFVGDASAAFNVPMRPFFDLGSLAVIAIGLFTAIRGWRELRHTMVLMTGLFLLPTAVLASPSPDFFAMGAVLPLFMLLFGLGIQSLSAWLPSAWRFLANVLLIAIVGFNLAWTVSDLFRQWPALEAVDTIYHGDEGRLARHIDRTARTTATAICADLAADAADPALAPNERVYLMMNDRSGVVRYVDCQGALLFAEGGADQQIILPEPETAYDTFDTLRQWLAMGVPLADGSVPVGSVLRMAIETPLADRIGVYTTTAPIFVPTDADGAGDIGISAPPVSFAGNMTFLGYDPPTNQVFHAGDVVPLTTYWRIEGNTPRDMSIFAHLLSDPVSIAAQRDGLFVNPATLRNRDILVHVSYIELPQTIRPGEYRLSVGVYEAQQADRLPVFIDGQPRGERVFLYPIYVRATGETAPTGAG
jgi:hypothetical protein